MGGGNKQTPNKEREGESTGEGEEGLTGRGGGAEIPAQDRKQKKGEGEGKGREEGKKKKVERLGGNGKSNPGPLPNQTNPPQRGCTLRKNHTTRPLPRGEDGPGSTGSPKARRSPKVPPLPTRPGAAPHKISRPNFPFGTEIVPEYCISISICSGIAVSGPGFRQKFL